MKRSHAIIFLITIIVSTSLLHGSLMQELIKTQEAKGIRVSNPEEIQFATHIQNLSDLIKTVPQEFNISNDENISTLLNSFYTLFFNPIYIKFSTKNEMNDFFDQLKIWHDSLKKSNVIVPWPANSQAEDLKKLLVLALKEICLFGRYAKHKEEHLVTFKLRLQYILTTIMLDPYLQEWKAELMNNNQEFSLGSFYSWEVKEIKQEFKDSVALTPLFNKLSTTINLKDEAYAAQQHEQEVAQEKERIAQHKQQDADILRAIIVHLEQQLPAIDAARREMAYLNYIRVLLDPAYLELSNKDRKNIDTFNEQFKKLHALIGKTFVPILSQRDIDTLKLLVAKSLETISLPSSGKTGGVSFKNHIESVLKTIMSISINQTPIENQIKFQWIKPLYTDNQLLTSTTKKKLLDIFNNQHFQRWQASTRNLSLKISPVDKIFTPITPSTPTERPLIRIPGPTPQEISKKVIEPSTPSKRIQQQKTEPQISSPTTIQKTPTKRPTVQKVTPIKPIALKEEIAPTSFKIIPPQLKTPSQTTQTPMDNDLYASVRTAASLGKADALAMLLKDLSPQQRFEIVTMRDQNGQTALHLATAAKSSPTQGLKPVNAVKELLRDLTQRQQVDFITMKDNNGKTAQDIAQQFNKAIAINLKEIVQRSRR